MGLRPAELPKLYKKGYPIAGVTSSAVCGPAGGRDVASLVRPVDGAFRPALGVVSVAEPHAGPIRSADCKQECSVNRSAISLHDALDGCVNWQQQKGSGSNPLLAAQPSALLETATGGDPVRGVVGGHVAWHPTLCGGRGALLCLLMLPITRSGCGTQATSTWMTGF